MAEHSYGSRSPNLETQLVLPGCLRWLDTVFSGAYLAFSIGVLPTFPYSDRCGNYTSVWKKIEVWLNVFFKVIDISMETINQKDENRKSMNFLRTRSENLMSVAEITIYGKKNMQEPKTSVSLIWNKAQRRFKPCYFCNKIERTERRTLF